MEKLDYKKEYKDLYLPKVKPMLIEVPNMKFIMVKGKGNPNKENGEYQEALSLLYALSFTIKMSKLGENPIKGYYEYVVPPLEGLWWNEESETVNYNQKEKFEWISMIRQPEFVTQEVFNWSCQEVKSKKGLNVSKAEFKELEEGLCVQMLHKGSYDEEPKTIAAIEQYIQTNQLKNDIGSKLENGIIRRHHEIYLSDPRKSKIENLKTVIRIPVVRKRKMTYQIEEDVVVVNSKEIVIKDVQSAIDFMMTVKYETNCEKIALNKEAIIEEFFVLSKGIAGEILQKFINYQMKFAIYGDFSRYTSKPLKDFIYESNHGKDIFFVENEEQAIEKLKG